MPTIRAYVKYKIRQKHSYTSHSWYFTMAGAYAGKTESAVLTKLKDRHGTNGEIIINSIEWR
ncbi:MAG: hypothetical protein ACO3CD_04615 [Candidatus Nanopelagicaceae bacterium]